MVKVSILIASYMQEHYYRPVIGAVGARGTWLVNNPLQDRSIFRVPSRRLVLRTEIDIGRFTVRRANGKAGTRKVICRASIRSCAEHSAGSMDNKLKVIARRPIANETRDTLEAQGLRPECDESYLMRPVKSNIVIEMIA